MDYFLKNSFTVLKQYSEIFYEQLLCLINAKPNVINLCT